MNRILRHLLYSVILIGTVGLWWPVGNPDIKLPEQVTVFRWDADELFASLEKEYVRIGEISLSEVEKSFNILEEEGRALLNQISVAEKPPFDALDRLTQLQLQLVVHGTAHTSLLPRAQDFLVLSRITLMKSASRWSMERKTHEALYQVIFGGRTALDEALIQVGSNVLAPLLHIEDIQSTTPSIVIEGVQIHSGDVLLSRGGAPTSALIARGSDFANTFSHAALVHVDSNTGVGTVIESLIERGSVLSSIEEYLEDKKHRILVLRIRPNHPAVISDPLLSHRVAESMMQRVFQGNVPYDFKMQWDDPNTMFCTEVVYHAFRQHGVELWSIRSSMSAPGLVNWLAALGVREFTTLVPSDVEYDPQLGAVVEWRGMPALMDYRMDNAIIDTLLEEADLGAELGYTWYMLPLARVLKLYSVIQKAIGATPTIPPGMSALTALRVDALVTGIFPELKVELMSLAEDFREDNGYEPPYWVLVRLARESLKTKRESLRPFLVSP